MMTSIPPTRRLYHRDTYLFTCSATVLSLTANSVILDKTIMHPPGGGQPADTGMISNYRTSFNVSGLIDDGSIITHIGNYTTTDLDSLFEVGDLVTLSINTTLRLKSARMHSAGHLLDLAVKAHCPDFTPRKGSHYEGNCAVEYVGMVEPEHRQELADALQATMEKLIQADLPVSVGKNDQGRRTVSYNALEGECGGTHVFRFGEIGAVKIEKISKVKENIRIKYSIT